MVKSKFRAFIMVDREVMLSEMLTIYDKGVLTVLCAHTDNTTCGCYPCVETIAREAGCSPRRVRSSVKVLEAAKIISVEHRAGKNGESTSNMYTVLYPYSSSAQRAHPPCTERTPPLHGMHTPPAQGAGNLYPANKTQSDYTQSSSSSAAAKKYWRKKIDYKYFADNMPEKIVLIEDLIDIFISLNETKYKKILSTFDSLALAELIDFLEKKDFSSAKSYKAYLAATIKNYFLKQSTESLY